MSLLSFYHSRCFSLGLPIVHCSIKPRPHTTVQTKRSTEDQALPYKWKHITSLLSTIQPIPSQSFLKPHQGDQTTTTATKLRERKRKKKCPQPTAGSGLKTPVPETPRTGHAAGASSISSGIEDRIYLLDGFAATKKTRTETRIKRGKGELK